jgi:hypothetical protein
MFLQIPGTPVAHHHLAGNVLPGHRGVEIHAT